MQGLNVLKRINPTALPWAASGLPIRGGDTPVIFESWYQQLAGCHSMPAGQRPGVRFECPETLGGHKIREEKKASAAQGFCHARTETNTTLSGSLGREMSPGEELTPPLRMMSSG